MNRSASCAYVRNLELPPSISLRVPRAYCAHLQRPAAYPPVDSTEPRQREPRQRDPLIHAIRQLQIAGECRAAVPGLLTVGTAYSYFQDYLPHVAQAEVRAGQVDFIGLGRVVLSYPELSADVLTHGELRRNRVCRTFSDCTNGPRMGFISGCFPLDPAYKALPEWKQIHRGRRLWKCRRLTHISCETSSNNPSRSKLHSKLSSRCTSIPSPTPPSPGPR